MRILVGTDFSECSDRALTQALRWARSSSARLAIAHICPTPVMSNPEPAVAQLRLDEARMKIDRLRDEAESNGIATDVHLLESGGAVAGLLQLIDTLQPDLVVVGRHGRGALGRLFLGSVSERILRDSPVPVLLVPAA
jgi:nucleotide-binding universal stress UspA family protein